MNRPAFARTGQPARFGKYDSVFQGFKFYRHVTDTLAQQAAKNDMDLVTYVREILIDRALGTEQVLKLQRDRHLRVIGAFPESREGE